MLMHPILLNPRRLTGWQLYVVNLLLGVLKASTTSSLEAEIGPSAQMLVVACGTLR